MDTLTDKQYYDWCEKFEHKYKQMLKAVQRPLSEEQVLQLKLVCRDAVDQEFFGNSPSSKTFSVDYAL